MDVKSLFFDPGKSLKDQNRWLIRGYIALHAAVLMFLLAGPDPFIPLVMLTSEANVKSAVPVVVGFILSSLAVLILLGLMPRGWRDHIVHMRLSHPLPGSRAFTNISQRDSRIDLTVLEARYGLIPSDPTVQNQLWYVIYNEFQDAIGVLDSHRSYLAARDLAWVTWIMCVLFSIPIAWRFGVSLEFAGYLISMVLVAIILSLVAQNYASRFVENVLAVASASNHEKLAPHR